MKKLSVVSCKRLGLLGSEGNCERINDLVSRAVKRHSRVGFDCREPLSPAIVIEFEKWICYYLLQNFGGEREREERVCVVIGFS